MSHFVVVLDNWSYCLTCPSALLPKAGILAVGAVGSIIKYNYTSGGLYFRVQVFYIFVGASAVENRFWMQMSQQGTNSKLESRWWDGVYQPLRPDPWCGIKKFEHICSNHLQIHRGPLISLLPIWAKPDKANARTNTNNFAVLYFTPNSNQRRCAVSKPVISLSFSLCCSCNQIVREI